MILEPTVASIQGGQIGFLSSSWAKLFEILFCFEVYYKEIMKQIQEECLLWFLKFNISMH